MKRGGKANLQGTLVRDESGRQGRIVCDGLIWSCVPADRTRVLVAWNDSHRNWTPLAQLRRLRETP